jgi:hypothetical protein
MTRQVETPAPQRRQAEGDTGARGTAKSVPGWAKKRLDRLGTPLVRFRGEYMSPAALNVLCAREADEARLCPKGTEAKPRTPKTAPYTAGPQATPQPEGSFPHPADHRDAPGSPLPCRFIEATQPRPPQKLPPEARPGGLSTHHKKAAAALSWNVTALVEKYGVERIGFLTLTFAQHILDPKEAQRRYNSLNVHVLSKRYAQVIRVIERQKSGRIHYHLLVVLPDDIRSGADFDAFAIRDYKSANNHLRREWAYWRHTAGKYGFGRTELMPIRSNAEAMGAYVGKYISKHIGNRDERDKGVRLVAYSKGCRMASTRYTSTGFGATEWRRKVYAFVHMTRISHPGEPVTGLASLRRIYGPKWSYQWRDFILNLPPADLTCPF